jgi:hypothetical protein
LRRLFGLDIDEITARNNTNEKQKPEANKTETNEIIMK